MFLNKMISTISVFIQDTKEPSLKGFKPLRYFVACQNSQVQGSTTILGKPGLMLVSLVDGCTQNRQMTWVDVEGLAETTRKKLPSMHMKEAILTRSYLTFCSQPDRDFLITLCFLGSGFYISVTDHSGVIETNLILFQLQSNTLIFLRMVLGLAFLSDEYLGVDTTITRRKTGVSSGKKFELEFPPFCSTFSKASVICFPTLPKVIPIPIPTVDETDKECRFTSISIGQDVYRVIDVIFESKALVGRATSVFLVKLPGRKLGIVKDSWVLTSMQSEAKLLDGIHCAFCPEVLGHCVLRNTASLRLSSPHQVAEMFEPREKRRVVSYPAGIHISDFSCMWELMIAFMDVAIGMCFLGVSLFFTTFIVLSTAIMCLESKLLVHRDISYTNVLLRHPGEDSQEKHASREKVIEQFDLTRIEKLRKQYKCREGLLVDFDYAARLVQLEDGHSENTASVKNHSGNKGDKDPSASVGRGDAKEENGHKATGLRTVRLSWFDLSLSLKKLYRAPHLSLQSSCLCLVFLIVLSMIWSHYFMSFSSSACISALPTILFLTLPYLEIQTRRIIPLP